MAPTRSPYNPRFFEYDCAQKNSMPRSAKRRTAAASSSRFPLAKPWYATSKKGT